MLRYLLKWQMTAIIIIRLISAKKNMEVINIDLLKELISNLKNYSKLSNSIKQVNEWCHFQFKCVKPEAIIATAEKINQRERNSKEIQPKTQADQECISWGFGEFKVFVWAIIYHCITKQIQLREINEEIIINVQNIFPLKRIDFIRYEIRLLISYKHIQAGNWSKQETKMFESIMNPLIECANINWKLISYRLFTQSSCKYFRNLNHCRQKWNNHLNPIVKKHGWTVQEDTRLFQLIDEFGLKWSKISKCMDQTRTEHMVKNRYNRFLRLWKIGKNNTQMQIKVLVQDYINQYKKKMGKSKLKYERIKMEQQSHDQEQYCPKQYEKNSHSGTNRLASKQYQAQKVKEQDIMAQEQSYHIKQNVFEPLTQKDQKQIGNLKQFDSIYYPFFNTFIPSYQSKLQMYPF